MTADSEDSIRDILRELCSRTTTMYKVKSNKQGFNKREFKLNMYQQRVDYKPSKKTKPGDLHRGKPYYYFRTMEEIRAGWITDVFNKIKLTEFKEPVVKQDYCFSIIFNNGKSTNLITTNKMARDNWVRALTHLVNVYKNNLETKQEEMWLQEQFRKADKNKNGLLSYSECKNVVNQMNISMEDSKLKEYFRAANFRRKAKSHDEEELDVDEFITFYKKLKDRPELNKLFNQHCAPNTSLWTPEILMKFLSKEQNMHGVTIEDCEKLIAEFSSEASPAGLTRDGFESLLVSEHGDIFNRLHKKVYQDMKRPLNQYFVATSHNTYLLADQLFGPSSIEGYIRALKRGCRCLEIDIHDGDKEPVVYHGKTLTSRVLFSDVIEAIKHYAFEASPYPVILSFENHCSVPQQQTMAKHLLKIFGDLLYKTRVSSKEKAYPSPEDLKNKILVKGKKIKDPTALVDEVLDNPDPFDELPKDAFVAKLMEKPLKMKLAKELSDLVNYFHASAFENFSESNKNWKFYQMASFSEGRAENLMKNDPKGFIKYNMHHFARTYPKGTRTASSNYSPVPVWNLGCQMVALNYQTNDMPMILNEAKFAVNGKCGYVLKPDFLINEKYDYDIKSPPDPKYRKVIILKIISGQHIPKPSGDTKTGRIVSPLVQVNIFGLPQDETSKKTKPVSNNGFNPQWSNTFEFVITMPDLAFIVFQVKDSDKLAAYAAYPVKSIVQGYRHVHLKEPDGAPLLIASLFVHVTIKKEG